MASYNKFHQKSFWATTMCVASVGFSSFFNGLVVFTILGFMAKESGMPVHEVAKASGPGLAFVAFPTALSHMPLPQLWSVLFFLMLITVVFDSLFGMFETVTSGVIDFFPKQLTNKRVLVNIITGLAFFVLGLPLTMNGGIYIFQLADWYFASFALLVGSALEAIGVCWFYGTDRFAYDIEMMTGRYVSGLLRFMWSIIIPFFVILTFIVLLSRYSTPAYGDGYVYSDHAIIVAIVVALTPIFAMIVVAIKELLNTSGGIRERVNQLLTPTHLWQPNDNSAKETYRLQPYRYASKFMERAKLNTIGPKDNPIF